MAKKEKFGRKVLNWANDTISEPLYDFADAFTGGGFSKVVTGVLDPKYKAKVNKKIAENYAELIQSVPNSSNLNRATARRNNAASAKQAARSSIAARRAVDNQALNANKEYAKAAKDYDRAVNEYQVKSAAIYDKISDLKQDRDNPNPVRVERSLYR